MARRVTSTREVEAGDGLSSIAAATGFFWQTLYDLPENAHLKSARPNPEILLPGDRVAIPELEPKTEGCATGNRHRFRRRGIPVRFILTVRDAEGVALGGARYALRVSEDLYEGTTGEDGRIAQWIAPVARGGTLTLWPGRDDLPAEVRWPVAIGTLDPIEAIAGVQARLENLGYTCEGERGTVGEAATDALRRFQRAQELPETGEIDDALRTRLAAVYGV